MSRSLIGPIFHILTPGRRLYYTLTSPLWKGQMREMWSVMAGCLLPHPSTPGVLIKPQDAWGTRFEPGAEVFVDGLDLAVKLRLVVTHELVHLCTAHLRLPFWLNEGIAMLVVDGYLGLDTVRLSTLDFLCRGSRPGGMVEYTRIAMNQMDTVAYHYARGYWTTRFLYEAHPELLCELLRTQLPVKEQRAHLAKAFGCDARSVHDVIYEQLCEHYRDRLPDPNDPHE